MTPNHVSHVVRVRRQVRRTNFEDETMRELGSNGSIESIRAQAEILLSNRSEQNNDSVPESEQLPLTRDEQKALVILDAIHALERIGEIVKDGVINNKRRSPEELANLQPLNRATLEGGRDNI